MALLVHARTVLFRPGYPRLLLGLWLGLMVFAQTAVHAQDDASREYELKAAFLYNFVQFVRWPEAAFSSPDAPFKIGILGEDPFGPALDSTIQGEAINGHKLEVIRSSQISDLEDCQMVFVCNSEEYRIDDILSQLGAKPILTISDLESFARKGGDINFYRSGDKIRFAINPESARHCGLQISSQLMSLGKIVEP